MEDIHNINIRIEIPKSKMSYGEALKLVSDSIPEKLVPYVKSVNSWKPKKRGWLSEIGRQLFGK